MTPVLYQHSTRAGGSKQSQPLKNNPFHVHERWGMQGSDVIIQQLYTKHLKSPSLEPYKLRTVKTMT